MKTGECYRAIINSLFQETPCCFLIELAREVQSYTINHRDSNVYVEEHNRDIFEEITASLRPYQGFFYVLKKRWRISAENDYYFMNL